MLTLQSPKDIYLCSILDPRIKMLPWTGVQGIADIFKQVKDYSKL